MDSLVTTAAKALDAKLSIVCDHHACDGRCDSAGCVDIRGAAEVVVGAVLAALRSQVEAIPPTVTCAPFIERGKVLALLAVVENDQQ